MRAPLVVGLAGTALTDAERGFLREVRPVGVIVFARNVGDGDGLARLVGEAKAAAGDALAFVDQEGGRVQRLRPPLAPRMPAAARIGALHARDPEAGRRAAFLAARLIAADIARFGLDCPCLPVADVPSEGAHDVIGDRAYARDPAVVAALAAAAAEGLSAGGAIPCVKHLPGHGRATVDSHLATPVVDAPLAALERDFAPFRALAGLPLGMTAHLVYTAIDRDAPGTVSPAVVRVIRERIGFSGLLLTDDIVMGAVGDDVVSAGTAALAAGCDIVLHCNGDLAAMERLAAALPPLGAEGERRLAAAVEGRRPPAGDVAALREEFAALMARLAEDDA
jgi:beta-N-acetylhexosaminidase